VAKRFGRYLKLAALDNGYRFFAPDPGPSHLIKFELTTKDGETIEGQFPKRHAIWPRLYYHRHFMLSEMTFALAAPTMELPPQSVLSPQDRAEMQKQKALSAELQQSIARFLIRQHPGAQRIRLIALVHGMPTPTDVRRGMQLDDPALYREFFLGEFSEADL
jgi:hypothetical protein